MNELETLELFFKELRKKDCKYTTIKKLLTKTQQMKSKFVGRGNVVAHIDGIWQLVNACTHEKIKEKFSTNEVMKTFKIVFFGENKVRFECTCLKEKAKRKPSIDGIWGVNIESFKLIKPK